MAPLLNSPFLVLEEMIDEMNQQSTDKLMSVWVKDKDVIRASTDITLLPKIEPGIYSVNFSKDYGYYCKKINVESDELFIFTDSITEDLLSEIENFWDKADEFKANKLIHKRGILLEGYPGTGKSSIVSILSEEIMKRGGVVFKVNGYRNLDDYIEFIRGSFRKIQPDTPIITILEDIDQYEDVEPELLDFLDGKTHLDHHVIIATTNNTEMVPDTFLRPSRIDLKIEVALPNEKIREEYFKFKNVPESELKELVTLSDNLSLADLKELYICRYLLDYSIEDAVAKLKSPRDKKCYLESPTSKKEIGF